ncbi:MAG: primosomal replication protein N [Xylophilus ampelinus]
MPHPEPDGSAALNRVVLHATIAETGALRYTPAGVPALDLSLAHSSSLLEAGRRREVNVTVKAVAFAAEAERLAAQEMGSAWRFTGFLGNARNGRSLVLHIQQFDQETA